ncbi:MAG TPA: cryptochrome/photolyase family protein [Planctomycetota bacterium]|nr:cryptochrome/photolyase family protein [Planctomycetota bacterium]
MKDATIIFPHQLFAEHPALARQRPVFLVEEQRFFSDFRFHKKKLVLHRASMRAYEDRLKRQGFRVRYVEWRNDNTLDFLFSMLRKNAIRVVYVAEMVDLTLERRFRKHCRAAGIMPVIDHTPMFLNSEQQVRSYFAGRNRFVMGPFYVHERRRLNVLVDGGEPVGGKWSMDVLNRRKAPPGMHFPGVHPPEHSDYVREAAHYVGKWFAEHPGTVDDFIYPVTHEDAERWLDDFLRERLELFGDYEDAIVAGEPFLFHSVISPLINIGLLTPRQVLDKTLDYARHHDVRLNSLEGFVRQIIGWREFIRAVYVMAGERQRQSNFWGNHRKLPSQLYSATTDIEPVDAVIGRLLHHAYTHHIERLMVLGNFMVLCEIDPNDVYRWFMELYIDAYDWVMVPNVYGMSQFADGGLMATKPYIGSYNYLRKMSDFRPGPWAGVWGALYWRFLERHRKAFEANPRMVLLLNPLKRVAADRINELCEQADRFLAGLFGKPSGDRKAA